MRQGFGATVAEVKSPLSRKEKLRIQAQGADALIGASVVEERTPTLDEIMLARAGGKGG